MAENPCGFHKSSQLQFVLLYTLFTIFNIIIFWGSVLKIISCIHVLMHLITFSPNCRHLGSNPFVCDCNLAWMAEYLTDNPVETSDARCQEPNRLSRKPFQRMKSDSFRCKYMIQKRSLTVRFFVSTRCHTTSSMLVAWECERIEGWSTREE